jgi:hypothetical protein
MPSRGNAFILMVDMALRWPFLRFALCWAEHPASLRNTGLFRESGNVIPCERPGWRHSLSSQVVVLLRG